MKRFLLIPLLTLLSALTICANGNENDEVKKKINSIKKNTTVYIYGEATAETEEEARGLAEEILYSEINAWVANKKKLQNSKNIVVNNLNELRTSMTLPRGNMFRAFIYVKKSDILPAENTTVLENTAAAPEINSLGSAEQVMPEVVKVISSCTEYTDMVAHVKQYKAKGVIIDYGRYASLDNPDNYYLAIYNTAGKVVAVLSPGAERKNVKTNKADGVVNYSGCGAIGFKLKGCSTN